MQCVRRCSFICGAVLSILLLLCSCQAGAGQLILPDNVPSENTSQGKKELLAALNQEYFDQFSSPNHFIQGSDDAAKTVFLYLKQYSGDDINKAVEALTENPKDDRANCADDVLRIISPSPSETYWVSYSFLSARKSQAFIAHKFSPFILSNFNMTIWPPSIPLVGSLRFPLLCSSCPLQFPPFSHVSHTAYADSPISRKQARKATSLLIYPSIFRG